MRRFLLALAVLFAVAPAAAQETQAFHSTDAGYTVQLPAGWRQIPDADVETMRQAGTARGMPYTLEAGFRLTGSPTGWPFILIAWMDLGEGFTPEQFGTMVTDAHAEAMREAGPEGTGIDALTWDAENRILWSRTTIRSGGPSGSFTLNASTLHPSGRMMAVFVYYATPGEDETRVRADLLRIVRSLRAD